MRINDYTQPCALSGMSSSGAPVVRAYTGTPVFSGVEALAASATRADSGWRGSSRCASMPVDSVLVGSVLVQGFLAGTGLVGTGFVGAELVESASGHEAARAASALGLKRAESLAAMAPAAVLEPRRPVVVDLDGAEREAAPAAGRGSRLTQVQRDQQDQHKQDQQDLFGTSGVGTGGYAFGISANGTSPIDPRDFRSSSPPG